MILFKRDNFSSWSSIVVNRAWTPYFNPTLSEITILNWPPLRPRFRRIMILYSRTMSISYRNSILFFHQPRPNSVLISSTSSIPIIVFHSVFIRPWNISIKYFSFDHVWKTEVKRSVMRFLVVMDCRKSAIEIRKNIHTRFNTLIEFKMNLNDLTLPY